MGAALFRTRDHCSSPSNSKEFRFNQFLPLLGGSNSSSSRRRSSPNNSNNTTTKAEQQGRVVVVVPFHKRLVSCLVAVSVLGLVLHAPFLFPLHQHRQEGHKQRKQQHSRVRQIDQWVRDIFTRAEQNRAMPKFVGAYREDYAVDFPELQVLQDNYRVIRDEAMALLSAHLDHIPRLKDLVPAERAKGKVYETDWKVFWFKMGLDIPENCARAPQTAALLRRVPHLHNAFFSVLAPHTHIDAHWGHYKGFLRYHLGLIVPHNNTYRDVFLRIRPDIEKNSDMTLAQRDAALANVSNERGVGPASTYYWKEGVGVMFDDNPLHDASNLSNETRVVLFLDVSRRPMAWYMRIFNALCILIANYVDPVASMRKQAVLDEAKTLSLPGKTRQRVLQTQQQQRPMEDEWSIDRFLQ